VKVIFSLAPPWHNEYQWSKGAHFQTATIKRK